MSSILQRGERGMASFGFVLAIMVMASLIVVAYHQLTSQSLTAAGLSRGINTAMQAADAGLNQVISDISNREIDVLGATLPLTLSYPVAVGSSTINVPVTLSYRRDGAGNIIQDLEGNNRYLADAVVSTGVFAVGARTKQVLTRHVQADISIVNLARYCMYVTANHTLSGSGVTFDGPYHTNGMLALGGTPYFNASKMSSGSANPFWSPSYVSMTALTFAAASSGLTACYSMYSGSSNAQAYLSNSGSYTVLATTSSPNGTWFDKSHGGFVTEQRPIPFATYYNSAQVILQQSTLPTFRINGTNYSSSNLTIDAGVNGQSPVVKINLSALGTGTNEDVCQGNANYVAALATSYGLIIYVDGPAGVYGRLPAVGGGTNTNKKVTVISNATIEMLGDILHSGDTYAAGVASYSTSPVIPTAAVTNPTNDAIALICPGNIYVNPWRKTTAAFFANSTSMKVCAFLYSETGMIAQGSRSWKTGGSSTIAEITYFGSQTKRNPGAYSGTFHILYDPTLNANVSKIIPVGISVNSWREVQ